jgi:hypothetical protein
MLFDILVAIVIVVIAAILGLVVHPILWIIIIAAALWLFTRRGSWARHY